MSYLLALSLFGWFGTVFLFLRHVSEENRHNASERNLLNCRIQTPELVPQIVPDGSDDQPAIGFEDEKAYWEERGVNGGS